MIRNVGRLLGVVVSLALAVGILAGCGEDGPPSIDYVVTLGGPIAMVATQSKTSAGSQAKVVTFDTSKQVVDGSYQSAGYFFAQYMARKHGWVTCTATAGCSSPRPS